MTSDKEAIFATLDELHAAQREHDVEAVLKLYATDKFVNVSRLRAAFEKAIEQDVFRTRTVAMDGCETFIHQDAALVKPVTYHTKKGPRYYSYHFERNAEGRWRVVDMNRSLPRGMRVYTDELMANAGKLVGVRGMLWTRRFEVPVEKVWPAVSTKAGLDQWFLTRSVEIDLRPGGLFQHHWTNTVKDFREHEFIDFAGTPDDRAAQDALTRFELKPDGPGTVFSFLDSFRGGGDPLSLPWTCSGWHGVVDSLERELTGREIHNDFGLGGEFYFRYLRDLQRLTAMQDRLGMAGTVDESWRAAFLVESQ